MENLRAIEVGKPIEGAPKRYNEEVKIVLDASGLQLINLMNKPTSKEVRDYKSGLPQFKLRFIEGIIFVLYRFGTQPWGDAPYNIHLEPDVLYMLPGMLDNTAGLAATIILADASDGTVMAARLYGLDHDFSVELLDAVRKQAAHEPPPDYFRLIQQIYARYSTADLLAIYDN